MTENRYEKGIEVLSQLFPKNDSASGSDPVFEYPVQIAGDWKQISVATAMGDIWSRPGLDKKVRAMISISALTVLDKPAQLHSYVTAALNLGVSKEEICEVVLQMAIYGGFPAVIQSLGVVNEVFLSRKED